MEKPSALPRYLRVWWLCCSPIALLFAARIAWEKTLLTWSQGPQMVGFSLMHTYPFFMMAGVLCSLALMVWLVTAIWYFIARRREVRVIDSVMIAGALFVVVAIFTPDNFFV
jgi:hypothetical protein